RDRKNDKTTIRQSDDQKSSNRHRISDNRHFSKIDIFSVIDDKRKVDKQHSSRSRKRISIKESQNRERQRREERCFNCNETRHMIFKCLKKKISFSIDYSMSLY